MPLTLFDVVRAEILGLGAKKNFELGDVERNLSELSETIPKEPKDHQTLFLRRFWIMEQNQKKTNDTVQKEIITEVRKYSDEIQLDRFSDKLKQYGVHYKDLLFPPLDDPEVSFSNRYLRDLYFLADSAVESHIPFLLAVRGRGFEEEDESHLFRLIESVWIMHNICRRGKWNQMDLLYASLCKDALKKEKDFNEIKSRFLTKSYEKLFSSKSDLGNYNSQQFMADFSTAYLQRSSQARVILRRFELSEKEEVGELKEKEIHVEHILPKKPAKGTWSEFADEEKHGEYVNRLGNLTLLHYKLNTSIGNNSFDKKKDEGYANSELEIAKKLCDIDDWTADEIDNRQLEMGKKATEIWPYFSELASIDKKRYGHLVKTDAAE